VSAASFELRTASVASYSGPVSGREQDFAIGRSRRADGHGRFRRGGCGGRQRHGEARAGERQVVGLADVRLDVGIGLAADGTEAAWRHGRAHALGEFHWRAAAPQRLECLAAQRRSELPALEAGAVAGDTDARIGGLAAGQLRRFRSFGCRNR
jgi:hypothetical protein